MHSIPAPLSPSDSAIHDGLDAAEEGLSALQAVRDLLLLAPNGMSQMEIDPDELCSLLGLVHAKIEAGIQLAGDAWRKQA